MSTDLPNAGGVIALPTRELNKATQSDREFVQSELRATLPEWCKAVREGVWMRQRWAMNCFQRAMALFEPDINLVVVLVRELGVGSLEEARAKISAASEAEPLTGDRKLMAQRMLEWLNDYHAPLGKKVVILDEAR